MNSEQNYIDINRQAWNNRIDSHLKSAFYNLDGFLKGESSLNDIELNLLGDLRGKPFCTCNVISDKTPFR